MPTWPHRTLGENVKGIEQLWQSYPTLEPLYSDFEKNYDADLLIPTMHKYQNYIYMAVLVYVFLVFRVKANPDAFNFVTKKTNNKTGKVERVTPGWLRHAFGIWNFCLSIFSFYGVVRTMPQLLHYIVTRDFKDVVCTEPTLSYGHGACGLATQLFILSKIPELGDTLFLALKGVKLDLLQWYHHSTVLAFCWHCYVNESGYGLWFVSMNYFVHAVMYMYFSLMNYKIAVPVLKALAPFITFIQISQMVVGTFIVGSAMKFKLIDGDSDCVINQTNLIFGGVIYTSYLCLFVQFAMKKYGPASKAKTA